MVKMSNGQQNIATVMIAWLLGMAFWGSSIVQADDNKPTGVASDVKTPPQIGIIPQDGFNLKIDDQINDHYVIVKLNSPAHNWFAGEFVNLPTDKEVTIGLSMEGNDTQGNKADVTKWQGLRPVMTYADPDRYDTYEYYTKDENGRWVSGDPFKTGDAKYAGNGKVPVQTAIPAADAEQFLSADGKYWQPWREVDSAEAVPNLNIFRIKQKFNSPNSTVSMRIPYTYTYERQFMDRLKHRHFPGVYIDKIGTSAQGRELDVIRIEDQMLQSPICLDQTWTRPNGEKAPYIHFVETDKGKTPRDVIVNLIYAREHATEHASSWMVHSAIIQLLDAIKAKQSMNNVIWLLIPILDPDGSANAIFDAITDHFYCHQNDPKYGNNTPIEVISYVRYLRAFINSGRPILLACSFHNIECNEQRTNIFSPFAIADNKDTVIKFNADLFSEMQKHGILTGDATPLDIGYLDPRLFGFCGRRYGSLPLAFEVNDRNPSNTQNMSDVENMCIVFVNQIIQFIKSEEGNKQLELTKKILAIRRVSYEENLKHDVWPREDPSDFDMLSLGF